MKRTVVCGLPVLALCLKDAFRESSFRSLANPVTPILMPEVRDRAADHD